MCISNLEKTLNDSERNLMNLRIFVSMTPFLKQVARHYFIDGAGDISRLCFVFPNRRALRFFEHYLGQEIAASGKGPAVAPEVYTINDFFYRVAAASPADKIVLLLELYECYKAVNPSAEPRDEFIFWGDMLLGDFDDVDKYLADARILFTNVSEFKGMQDDMSYLSDTQREALERFTDSFLRKGAVKEKFLGIWNLLYPLYTGFRERLASKGIAYEGMVYREFAERLKKESAVDVLPRRFPETDKFVFVGLNALSESERTVLRHLHKAGVAEFCWDFRSDLIRNKDNKASLFLGSFYEEFKPSFEPDPEGLPQTEFNLLSVPGGIAQAKQIPAILERCTPDPGIDTAVVLSDEKLLLPVLNSIPEHVQKLNVTMGYPIGGSQMWTLLTDLFQLQLHLRKQGDGWLFYHRALWAVASNSIIRSAVSEEGAGLLEAERRLRRYYIPADGLIADPVLAAILRPVVTDTAPSAATCVSLCRYLQDILVTVAPRLKGVSGMELELDFAKLCFETIDRLAGYGLELSPTSLFRLLKQVLGTATVPFEGEPLEGMQIMGPLEMRALDFDNLIILSMGEGIFPRRSVSGSFIPPELRKGFGLPTSEYQDAVWAYYFYRMIQRAGKVWMVYDSSPDGLKGGECSRYVLQLEMHFRLKVNHYEVVLPLGSKKPDQEIEKTTKQLERLREKPLSPSAMKSYFACPVRFFYERVEHLKADREVSDSLDPITQGNVLHGVIQALYPAGSVLTAGFLESILKDKARIRSLVREGICKQLKTYEVTGRNIVFEDIICKYAEEIIKEDLRLAENGTPARIIDVETGKSISMGGFEFIGFIDRLDSLAPGELRVVDYKTGGVKVSGDILFEKDTVPSVGLQIYLYKLFLGDVPENVTGSVYCTAAMVGGKRSYDIPLDPVYCSTMQGKIDDALQEISDTSIPWKRTTVEKTCKHCDFKTLCGR